MKLPEKIREQFKSPLGILLPEKNADKQHIQNYLTDNSYIVTVGDKTTEKLIEFKIIPSLQIVDGQEKRVKREPPKLENVTTITCDNPAATIADSSIDVIKKAFKLEPPVRILVNGEEDLLVLPVCVHAPENAVVFYGQPNEGLVVVKVNQEIRNKTQELLDLME
ncbi:MAG: GTP-dependent dephospho-CoA kinase family protein [Nitrosopumilaceae archaeon]|nr:GTP-dependent dephospho-CoA kinase family protein [Nitrosopumilaceae archaeon]